LKKKLAAPKPDSYYIPSNMSPTLDGIYFANSLPGDPTGNQAVQIADLDLTRERFIDIFSNIKKVIDDYIEKNNTKNDLHNQAELINDVADIIEPERKESSLPDDFMEKQREEYENTQELLKFFNAI